jgi:hypothetical protein
MLLLKEGLQGAEIRLGIPPGIRREGISFCCSRCKQHGLSFHHPL